MFGWTKPFLNADDEAWHVETWRWLIGNFGLERLRGAPLVTATREFFPPTEAVGHERAVHVLATIKQLSGFADWPCDLVAQAERPDVRVAEVGMVKLARDDVLPLGTFSQRGNVVTIAYDPASVGHPAKLVATLAHELAHYLLHSVATLPPGGTEMEEYATDLTTVFLGFGLFGANMAFNFSQFRDVHSQGWRTSSMGYLRERDWAFALAMFCAMRGQDVAALKPWLKANLYIDTQNAARDIKRRRVSEMVLADG